MIDIKTEKEIEIMAEGGKILGEVLTLLVESAHPGITELELDKMAETEILKRGGEPGFKKVDNYPNAICVSTNDVVVHGLPTSYKLKERDVLGIDCGVFYKGFHTDMAETFKVGNKKIDNVDRFLKFGKRALMEGIKAAKKGNRIGDISKTLQDIIEKEGGYSIVRTLVGHGVGRQLHEEPHVPGFLSKPISKTPKLREGMTITVEVIYNMGKKEVYTTSDNWTIRTQDKSFGSLFERSVAISKEGPRILTPFAGISEAHLI